MPAGDQVGVGDAAGPGQSFGIHDHDKDPEGGVLSPAVNKNTLGSPAVQPAYLEAFPFPLMGMYGDGSDGDFNCAGLTVLTKDMNFRNLHVFNGGILYSAGFIVRVWGKITVDAGGAICCDGYDGGPGNDATGAGGLGGLAAIITPNLRWLKWQYAMDGGKGGDGVGLGVNVGLGGGQTLAALDFLPMGNLFQGVGGSGGGGLGLAANPGVAASQALNARDNVAGGPAKIINAGVVANIGGGGGGGGGGAMEIWANEIDNAGRITCRGGKGGDGYFKTVGVNSSFSGNGSGGNGGVLQFFYRKASGAGLGAIDCAGGLPGVHGNGGGAGNSGILQLIQVGA